MNTNEINQVKLSPIELYNELIKICQNIAENLNIPT